MPTWPSVRRGHDPVCEVRGVHDLGPGRVEVRTFDTDRAETEHVADLLRRAHLEDGVAWSDMAVLVRSGRSSIPALRVRNPRCSSAAWTCAGKTATVISPPAPAS